MDFKIVPFDSREAASYWGGGVIVPALDGGYWSLHAISTPAGVEFFHVGRRTGRQNGVSVVGWPPDVRGRYVYAVPENGGQKCICALAL